MTAKGVDSPNVAALFEAANKLRGSVESGEYKHLVLGPIFLKYISDAFEQRRRQLEAELADRGGDSFIEDPAARPGPRGPRRVRLRECVLGSQGGPVACSACRGGAA